MIHRKPSGGVKDKGLTGRDEADDENEGNASQSTKSSLPSKLYINHSPSSSSRIPFRPRGTTSTSPQSGVNRQNGLGWESLLSLLPKSVQIRLRPIVSNPWLLAALSIPIPLVVIATVIITIRRKILKKRNELAGRLVGKVGETAVAVGQSTVAVDAMADVRAKLRRTRAGGMLGWFRAWLGWWIKKFGGVWKMATTITYL